MDMSPADTDLISCFVDAAEGDEIVPPGETAALWDIVASIQGRVAASAFRGIARRDAHPKAHGCVHASFRVLDALPEPLRIGLFAEPRRYEALIRFSNGSETPQPDRIGDGRGMAVKVLDVSGSRSGTQDFVMINNPAFFVRNALDYVQFQHAAPQWRFFVPGWNPLHWRLHEFMVARAITRRRLANPVDGRYWSMTPYRFGATQCKFSARPAGAPSPFDGVGTPDFLHNNLCLHLAALPAEFDFMVQLRGDPARMPIEDPTIEWTEARAPFVTVARISIPPQQFDQPAQQVRCENLSFTPWHGLDAHRPLGGINRVRRTVYETVSRLRHELNGVPREEPVNSQR